MYRKGDYIFIETGVGDFIYEANIKILKPEHWTNHLREKEWWTPEFDEPTFLKLCNEKRI